MLKKILHNKIEIKNCMKYRTELYGIMALLIIVFHIYGRVGLPGLGYLPFISPIISNGNFGVDVFLLLSAIGLTRSISKNTVKQFYINRIKRVFIPFLIIAIPFFIWSNFVVSNDGIINFLLDVTTINFWIKPDYHIWYVSFILVFYAVFPLLHKADKKTKHISTILILIISVIVEFIMAKYQVPFFVRCERAISRIPICMVGILLAPMFFSDKKIGIKTFILDVVIFVLSFYAISKQLSNIIAVRYLYGVASICLVVSYGIFRALIINKGKLFDGLKWVGAISLETYVIHVVIVNVLGIYDVYKYIFPIAWYVIVIITTVVISYLLSKLCKRIIKN